MAVQASNPCAPPEGAGAEEETTLDPAYVISLIRRLLPPDDCAAADAAAAAENAAAAEEAAQTLWDVSAAPEHAPFLLRHQLPRAAAACLLREGDGAPSARLCECALGVLANLLCRDAAALAADASVVLAVAGAGLCGADDPGALAEACRGLRAAVRARGAPGAAWRAAVGDDGRERLLAVLRSTVHAPLVTQAADLVTALALSEAAAQQTPLLRAGGALPAALAALAALPRLRGGDAHAAADAAARCVEALVTSEDACFVPDIHDALEAQALQAAVLPPLADAESHPELAASVCIALSCVLAALEKPLEDDPDTARVAARARHALLGALAADEEAAGALRALASGSAAWWGVPDAAAQQAACELLQAMDALPAPQAEPGS